QRMHPRRREEHRITQARNERGTGGRDVSTIEVEIDESPADTHESGPVWKDRNQTTGRQKQHNRRTVSGRRWELRDVRPRQPESTKLVRVLQVRTSDYCRHAH